MMTRKLTTLLLIGLMLAVPLRAVAGLAMFGCASGHQAAIVSVEHADGSAMQAKSGCNEDHQAASSMHDSCSHGHDQGSKDKHAGTTCNICSSCCTGALSIPMFALAALGLAPISSTPIAFLDQPYAGFLPEGPERPPRHAHS